MINKIKNMNPITDIPMISPPFEFIRQHKTCAVDTQLLVLKRNAGRIDAGEMLQCFENGVAGDYGKFINADAQTLLRWLDEYHRDKMSSKNYLQRGLLPVSSRMRDQNYLQSAREWQMEANKCYQAFINGVNERNFHPHIYDRLMFDEFIEINSVSKFFEEDVTRENADDETILKMIVRAKQKCLKKYFEAMKERGVVSIYSVNS